MKKIDYKSLIINIIIPLSAGALGVLLGGNMQDYALINKPNISPSPIVFPIVWTILYILLGISSYIIKKTNDITSQDAFIIYALNLFVNTTWTLFFFRLKWYLFAFIWIIILIILTIILIYKYYKINKTAAYLQIPYLLWLIFASILNISIYILNK